MVVEATLLTEILDLIATPSVIPNQIAELIALNPHELESTYGVTLRTTSRRARLRMVTAGEQQEEPQTMAGNKRIVGPS